MSETSTALKSGNSVSPIVDSKLMQNYRIATPVSAGNQIAIAQNKDGELEVYSIGSDQTVYHFLRDPASDTGWSQRSVGIKANTIAAGLTSDGKRIVFANMVGEGRFVFVEEDPSTETGWGNWQQCQNLPIPNYIIARNIGSQLHLAVFTGNFSCYGVYHTVCQCVWNGAQTIPQNSLKVNSPNMVDLALVDSKIVELVALLTPKLVFQPTENFYPNHLYWDKKSGASKDVTFWRPISPDPTMFYNMGDYAQGDYDSPRGTMLSVGSIDDPTGSPLLAPPIGFTEVWNDRKSGATEDGSVWCPIAPEGYVAIGGVATGGYDQPDNNVVRCLRSDWVEKGNIGKLIYNDRKSHATKDISVYSIDPATGSQQETGCFYAQNNYDPPNGTVYNPLTNAPLKSLIYMQSPFATVPSKKLPILDDFRAIDLAVTQNDQGEQELFIIKDDDCLYHLDQTTWQWIRIREDSADLANLTNVYASRDRDGKLNIFVKRSDGKLYHLCQEGENGQWTNPTPLAENVSQVVLDKHRDGYCEVFFVGFDHTLHHLSQDLDTSDWHSAVIEQQYTGEVEPMTCYSMEITILDENGQIQPRKPVSIKLPNLTMLTINGSNYWIDSNRPVDCQTNDAGIVNVVMPVDSLSTDKLYIHTQFMSPETYLEIVPNDNVREYLKTITPNSLLDAKDAQGNLLLSDPKTRDQNANALAPAISQCMSLVESYPSSHLNDRQQPNLSSGVRYVSEADIALSQHINLQAVPEQYWQVNIVSGQVFFEYLTPESAELLITKYKDSFSVLDIDWGDLWNAVKKGLATLKDGLNIIVRKTEQGIETVINLTIDGITYVYQKTIKLIQQAFDLVEGLLIQLEISFQKMVDWLADKFMGLFPWADILRTQEALIYSFDQVIGFAELSVSKMQLIFDRGMQSLQSRVEQAFTQEIERLAGNSIDGYKQSHEQPNPILRTAMSNNIVYSEFLNYSSSATFNFPTLAPEDSSRLQSFSTQLESYINTIGNRSEFANAKEILKQIHNDPDQTVDLLMSNLLSLAKDIVSMVLSGLTTVGNGFFQLLSRLLELLKELLNTEISVPIFSHLFAYMTRTADYLKGQPLTPLNLMTLIVAVPVTLYYKKTKNAVPFPTDIALQQFKASFNAQALLDTSGIINLPPASLAGEAVFKPVATTVAGELDYFDPAQFFGLCYSVNYVFYGLTEAILDSIPPNAPAPMPLTIGALVLELMAQVFSVPWYPWSGNKNLPWGRTPGEFENLIYLYQFLGLGIDGFFVLLGKKLPRNSGDIGVICDTIYGTIHAGAFLSLSVWEIAEGEGDELKSAQNLISTIPEFSKLLRETSIVADTVGASLVGLTLLDLLGDLTVAYINQKRLG